MSSKAGAIKDKWKMKKWFQIVAPRIFSEVSLGSTPAFDSSYTINRKVETTLYDLTGDMSMVNTKVYFKVVRNEGDRLFTIFYGHELARDYIRSLIRRKSSKIQVVVDVTTKDGYILRVKALALTSFRCQRAQKTGIRKIMTEIIEKAGSESNFDEMINGILFGKVANEIYEKAKKIYPLRNVEMEKSRLLKIPQAPKEVPVESSSASSG